MADGYLEIVVAVAPEVEEAAIVALDACGTLGAWCERPGRVRAYFEPRPEVELRRAFREAWSAAAGEAPLPAVEIRSLADADWLAPFRRTARPVQVGALLWVAPPQSPPPAGGYPAGAIVVSIRPGQGFGTGSHPTTRSLLRWLEAEPGFETVLDVGAGSGVLAVAALALGARQAVGLELDEAAIDNARENRALNRASTLLLVRGSVGALAPRARFDRVLANLDRATLLGLVPALATRVARGGRLGLAGLLEGEESRIVALAEASGLRVLDASVEEDPTTGDAWWSGWLGGPT